MNQAKYDKILREGLIRYKELEFADIPPEDEIEHVFSEKYTKAMDKLIESIDKPYRRFTDTAAKRIAIIAACLILALSSILAVGAVREKLVEFFYSVFDTHTSISTVDDKDAKDFIEINYTIPNVPEGYSLIKSTVNEFSSGFLWENSDELSIYLDQQLLPINFSLNSEDSAVNELIVNDVPCIYVEKDDAYVYYWEFEGYGFELCYPIELGTEFAENTIGKLIPVAGDEQ